MSRLTERTRYGIVGNNDRVINYPLYKIADADPLDHRIVGQCFEKLADYEDAEEQCIKETSFGFKELLHKWKTFTDDVQELLEYRRLEEQGLLPRFHLGDEFWIEWLGEVLKAKIVMLQQKKDGTWKYRFCDERSHTMDYEERAYGKYFWSTKEEAEQKLESMQKGES